MPLLVHSMFIAFAVHRVAVKLPRETDRKIGDVDTLLDLADAFRPNLPHLKGHQLAKWTKMLTEGVANPSHNLAAFWSRKHAP